MEPDLSSNHTSLPAHDAACPGAMQGYRADGLRVVSDPTLEPDIEVIADRQKSAFNADPNNKGRWIDTGLWKTSQHPNYFGETLLWTGLFIAGIPSYTGLEWLACISPIFVCLLLTRGSGIPLLDERAMAKWGDDPEYLAYRERTSKFICLPSKG